MSRDRDLTQFQEYPPAPAGCESLARWRQTPGWLAGRLQFSSRLDLGKGHFQLVGLPDRSVEIHCLDMEKALLEVLQPGDHVAVELVESARRASQYPVVESARRASQCPAAEFNGVWTARRMQFLAPGALEPVAIPGPEWPAFVRHVRRFFEERGLVEIETPSLVRCPGMEPSLEPFATEWVSGGARRGEKFYLPTSPEIHLKKALCLGHTDIFEIKPCFRNGENSATHQPEFLMLEWYRAYADLEMIRADLTALILAVGGPTPTTTTFATLFREKLGVELRPDTSPATYREWCEKFDLHPHPSDSATDLFHRLWIEKIEPELAGAWIVRDFPPAQAALARIKPDGWADRFEFYWNGLEIANAFHEVNEPKEQERRWELERAERARLGTSTLLADDKLLKLMRERGMPPTGGIALGLERLYMAARGIKDIRALRLFPY